MARYDIQAKRKNTNEEFTAWTETDNYKKAVGHVAYVEECGFLPNLVLSDEVKTLWGVLGEDEKGKEQTDAVLDKGFLLTGTVVNQILRSIDSRCRREINEGKKELEAASELETFSELDKERMVAALKGYTMAYEKIRKIISTRYARGDDNNG